MAHLNTTQNSVVEQPTIQPHETVTFGETLPTPSLALYKMVISQYTVIYICYDILKVTYKGKSNPWIKNITIVPVLGNITIAATPRRKLRRRTEYQRSQGTQFLRAEVSQSPLLPPVLSTCPLHTNSGCGKERRILIGPW